MKAIGPIRLLPLTILAMAGLLVAKSAQLVHAAAATASEQTTTTAPAHASAVEAPKPASVHGTVAPKPPDVMPGPPPISDGERTVLLELRQRRQELDGREATLAARESVLVATELKLSARVAELQALQKKLEGLETAREQREDTSWRGLVKLYESMKPRDAAVIFNDLDMPVLLQVVDRMKEAKAAPVVAAMQADKARELTTKLADMRTRRDNPSGS
jgi:flagellar motility protein MotE (MotC chaperone)